MAGYPRALSSFLQEIDRRIGGAMQIGPAGTPVKAEQRPGQLLASAARGAGDH
jgi:hypothetical protein